MAVHACVKGFRGEVRYFWGISAVAVGLKLRAKFAQNIKW